MENVKVTEEQIKEWKNQYTYVYKINVLGKDYYVRTLDRDDYVDILAIQASMKDPRTFDHDFEVCKKCVLSRMDETELKKKSGIAVVLAERIMVLSGFENPEITEL